MSSGPEKENEMNTHADRPLTPEEEIAALRADPSRRSGR
jgi:hypothetical protein